MKKSILTKEKAISMFRKKIISHYSLIKPPSDGLVIEEAKNLLRKAAKENLDDRQEKLYCSVSEEILLKIAE